MYFSLYLKFKLNLFQSIVHSLIVFLFRRNIRFAVIRRLLFFLIIGCHNLLQTTIKLVYVCWNKFLVAKNLLHQLFLIFFPDEPSFDPQAFIRDNLSAIVGNLLIPLPAVSFGSISLYFLVSFF